MTIEFAGKSKDPEQIIIESPCGYSAKISSTGSASYEELVEVAKISASYSTQEGMLDIHKIGYFQRELVAMMLRSRLGKKKASNKELFTMPDGSTMSAFLFQKLFQFFIKELGLETDFNIRAPQKSSIFNEDLVPLEEVLTDG